MGQELLICNGDMIQITMDPPTVCPTIVAPLPLVATGNVVIDDMVVCIVGDEYAPVFANNIPVTYMAPPYVIPGMGTIKLTLKDSNKSNASVTDADNIMLCKGGDFDVELSVMVPAMQPSVPSPIPDSTTKHTGKAKFITTNSTVFAESG